MEHRSGAKIDVAPRDALALPNSGVVVGADDHLPSPRTLQRAEESVPETTRRARAYVLGRFEAWCDETGRVALPATGATLADYVTFLAEGLDRSPASIEQAIGLIRGQHRRAGHPDRPDTTLALASLKRHNEPPRRVRRLMGLSGRPR